MKTVQAKLSRKIDRRLRFNKAFMNIVASRNASRMFWSFISCQEGFICQKRWKYATCLLPYTVATWFDYGHNKRRSIFVSSLTPRTMWPRAAVGPARPRLPHLLAGEGFYRDSICCSFRLLQFIEPLEVNLYQASESPTRGNFPCCDFTCRQESLSYSHCMSCHSRLE